MARFIFYDLAQKTKEIKYQIHHFIRIRILQAYSKKSVD